MLHGCPQGSKPASTMPSKPLLLKFTAGGNAKLSADTHSFSLLSGHSCPGASTCLAKVNLKTGKLEEGPNRITRCFSATQELAFKPTRLQRQHNFEQLRLCRTEAEMVALIQESMPPRMVVLRLHIGGDFYSQTYFNAWMTVVASRPKLKVYAYTKSIPFWLRYINVNKALPKNMTLVASRGGKFDDLIQPWMRTAEIVMHPDEAAEKGLKIDHDDMLARQGKTNFALLLHGVQPVGTPQAAALKRMRLENVAFSYSSKIDHAKQ